MARKASADRRYLEQKSGKWRVTVPVPRDLHGELGTRLKHPLRTDSLAVANSLKWPIVAEFRERIGAAQHKYGSHSLQREAVEIAEHHRLAKSDDERDMIVEGIVQRAEDLRGEPIRSNADPYSDQPAYEYDADRERRADEYAEVALGRATPLGLHHKAYVKDAQTKHRTQADDRRALKYLTAWCSKKGVKPTLEAITRRTAARFLDEIREVAGDHSALTLNKYLGRLSRYWQWLTLRSIAEADPWAKLKVKAPPSNHEETERPFTDDEVAKLLAGPAIERMQDLMRIGALTGARLEAIVDLRVKGCADGVFTFKPQKKETKPRAVPIHPDLASIVARRTAGKADDDSLFPEWPTPKRVGSNRERSFKASTAFTEYRRLVGVDERVEGKRRSLVNFHSFRRWFITKAERADQPPHIIAAVVGHKRQGMTLGLYSGGPELEQRRACVESVKLPV